MSEPKEVFVRVLRNLWLHGEVVQAGSVVAMDALEAGDCVASRGAELVDQEDAAVIMAAIRRSDAAMLSRRSTVSGPPIERDPRWAVINPPARYQ